MEVFILGPEMNIYWSFPYCYNIAEYSHLRGYAIDVKHRASYNLFLR